MAEMAGASVHLLLFLFEQLVGVLSGFKSIIVFFHNELLAMRILLTLLGILTIFTANSQTRATILLVGLA